MRFLFFFKLIFVLLAFTACQQEMAKSVEKPLPPPKKKAKFKREVYDAEKYPGLNAVGKIKILKTKWCTVTLLAEDIGITAGHCFLGSSKKFNLEGFTEVEFKTSDNKPIKGIKIERVLKRRMNPDFAIVKLNKKIPKNLVKPLEISELEFSEMLGKTESLGCAAFNGDRELGKRGNVLTISRNIRIFYKTSSSKRIDTNCVSTHGGSGGLFFEEKYNSETQKNEYYFVGVIWGVTGDNYSKKGEVISREEVVTSITPVKVFIDELEKSFEKN